MLETKVQVRHGPKMLIDGGKCVLDESSDIHVASQGCYKRMCAGESSLTLTPYPETGPDLRGLNGDANFRPLGHVEVDLVVYDDKNHHGISGRNQTVFIAEGGLARRTDMIIGKPMMERTYQNFGTAPAETLTDSPSAVSSISLDPRYLTISETRNSRTVISLDSGYQTISASQYSQEG